MSSTRMTPQNILLITIHAARMPGIGGEVRAHYFIRAATELGNVTLVSLCGSGVNQQVPLDLVERCEQVIQPSRVDVPMINDTPSKGRLAAWRRTLLTILFPWRRQWQDFLNYGLQFCSPATGSPGTRSERPSRRLLSAVLRLQYRVFACYFRLPPLTSAAYASTFDQLLPAIQQCLRRRKFDVIWVEDVFAYPFAEKILSPLTNKNVTVICNSYNIEAFVFERTAQAAESKQARSSWKLQSRVTRTMEERAYSRSDLIFVCSDQDRQRGIKLVPEGNFQVVGNGVDIEYFRPDASGIRAKQPTLLFTGGFGYGPNREALKYFIRQILPLIRKQRRDVRFVFAGSQAGAAWLDLGIQDPAVECISDPADIRPCFQQAWVFVVPLLVGGGTRLKILEAMAMERAVVSTRIGAEGLNCQEGEHLLLADAPQSFANAVIRLLDDDQLRNRLEQTAAYWVRNRHSWASLSRDIVTKVGAMDAR